MDRRFYAVWIGQLVSGIGSGLTAYGVAFWVFKETDSTAWLAVIFGATAMSRLVATPLTGLVDRFNRRLVMVASDTGAAVVTAAVIWLWATGNLTPWYVVTSTIMGGIFGSVQQPAYSAAIPTLVDATKLDRANGLVQIGPSASTVVVPGISGALVAWVGLGSIFIIDISTFLVGVVTAAVVRFGDVTERAAGDSFRLRDAVRWLRADGRSVAALTLALASTNVALAGVSVAMVARARDLGGDAAVGLGPTAGGVGMTMVSLILGARGIPRWRRIPAVGMAMVGLGTLLALSVAASSLPLFVVCVGLAMSTMPFFVVSVRTIFQQWVPPHLLGRVFGVLGAATAVTEPLGLLVAVPLVGWSVAGSLAVAGAVVAMLGVAVALSSSLRPLNHPPQARHGN